MVGWEAAHSKLLEKPSQPASFTKSLVVLHSALVSFEMRRAAPPAPPLDPEYTIGVCRQAFTFQRPAARGAPISSNRTRDRTTGRILGVDVDRISCGEASDLICDWATLRSSRMVLAANVHMTMEAVDDRTFREIMNEADLVVADGLPLVWALKARRFSAAHHVRGQDLVLGVCETAEERQIKVGMYGTTAEALGAATRNLLKRFPRLNIVFSYAPPFRPLDLREDRHVIDAINGSGTQILLVATGCPKQEKWMAAHMSSLKAVMIGAGAAIDMIGERQPIAPRWMQSSGLEWVFRLASDPARLWRRYAKHNLRFIALVTVEIMTAALRTRHSRSLGTGG